MNVSRGLAIPIILTFVILIIGLTAVVVLGDVDESDVSDDQEHMAPEVLPGRTPGAGDATPAGQQTLEGGQQQGTPTPAP
jgi:hypothetical protein